MPGMLFSKHLEPASRRRFVRISIKGPTGAFVLVLAGIVAAHGNSGLALIAGLMLVLAGVFRLNGLIKFIPYPVIAAATMGIVVIIFVGQRNEALGLGLKMPPHIPREYFRHGHPTPAHEHSLQAGNRRSHRFGKLLWEY